ncbi:MAG: hypothetical protein GX798_00695 [Bacteroidales bacterium]|jgi:Tfp pilus assembly protein PilO|nr:hypothetical protein [Bacteroidales bacterium]
MGLKRKILDKTTSFFSGSFILKRRLDRFLWFFIYLFVLIVLFISWNLYIESRLVKIEKNSAIIKDLEINRQQRALELVSLDYNIKVEKMLQDFGSKLHAPTDQPIRVKGE